MKSRKKKVEFPTNEWAASQADLRSKVNKITGPLTESRTLAYVSNRVTSDLRADSSLPVAASNDGSSIALRDANGRLACTSPTSSTDAVNLNYLTEGYYAKTNHSTLYLKSSLITISLTQDAIDNYPTGCSLQENKIIVPYISISNYSGGEFMGSPSQSGVTKILPAHGVYINSTSEYIEISFAKFVSKTYSGTGGYYWALTEVYSKSGMVRNSGLAIRKTTVPLTGGNYTAGVLDVVSYGAYKIVQS